MKLYYKKNTLVILNIGALVSKPNLYRGRSWEFNIIDSVDVTDSYLANISIYNRGNEIYRIQPRSDRQHTNNWISDKSRYLLDSFDSNRIIFPSNYLKNNSENITINILYNILQLISKIQNITVLLGSITSLEDISFITNFQRLRGVSNIYYNYFHEQENNRNFYIKYTKNQINTFKKNFVLNEFIENMHIYDCYIFASNTIRYELPLLYTKLKISSQTYDIDLISIGFNLNKKDSIKNIHCLKDILYGKHILSKKLGEYKHIQFFVNNTNNLFFIHINNLCNFSYYIKNKKKSNTTWNNIEYECGVITSSYIAV